MSFALNIHYVVRFFCVLISSFVISLSYSQITITLRKSFIDSFKNRITIDADYSIFFAHPKANPPDEDGDLHIAGYDKKIGLPTVAELMNAADEDAAVKTIHDNEGANKPSVKLSGAWRLWSEHIKSGDHYFQGIGSKSIKNTNPDHVFEIHPLVSLEGNDLSNSIRTIKGYSPHKANKAFSHYLNIESALSSTNKTVSIKTKGAKYNYSDFWIRLNSTEKFIVDDGLFVYCTVLGSSFNPNKNNADKNILSYKVRMAFPKDTDGYNMVKSMKKNEFLRVIGIPRISLNEISLRIKNANKKPGDLNEKLPVEMIVVGIIKK